MPLFGYILKNGCKIDSHYFLLMTVLGDQAMNGFDSDKENINELRFFKTGIYR